MTELGISAFLHRNDRVAMATIVELLVASSASHRSKQRCRR
jgi:hypothetical protein